MTPSTTPTPTLPEPCVPGPAYRLEYLLDPQGVPGEPQVGVHAPALGDAHTPGPQVLHIRPREGTGTGTGTATNTGTGIRVTLDGIVFTI